MISAFDILISGARIVTGRRSTPALVPRRATSCMAASHSGRQSGYPDESSTLTPTTISLALRTSASAIAYARKIVFRAGTYVTGKGKDGRPKATYLYHVVSNEETMGRDGAQAVVWQTAINPVIALELLASNTWSGEGVLGPEAFDAVPFLDLLAEHGTPHGVDERTP